MNKKYNLKLKAIFKGEAKVLANSKKEAINLIEQFLYVNIGNVTKDLCDNRAKSILDYEIDNSGDLIIDNNDNTRYLRYDYIEDNNEIEFYDNLNDLLQRTNEFYHDTFKMEEGYDENKEYTTLKDAIELWEGSGYGIAEILK